jgi:hypothetical protein
LRQPDSGIGRSRGFQKSARLILPITNSLIALTLLWSFTSFAATLYVSLESASPAPPYATWSTAATNIQDAVDAASAGDEVVVTNGAYASGAVMANGESNRVALTKPLVLRSVNGPSATVIEGYQVPGTTNGETAIRCVYITNGATLIGFTLTNGATKSPFAGNAAGGGVLCESRLAVVSNCVFRGNAAQRGGGAAGGTLNNCVFIGNCAGSGGGTWDCVLNNSILSSNVANTGGGAAVGILNNCEISGNMATTQGGGVTGDPQVGRPMTLNNCVLYGNRAPFSSGGGAAQSTLNNCTVVNNTSKHPGGGAWTSVLNNSILYYNSSEDGSGPDHWFMIAVNYCCLPILAIPGSHPTGTGNITNEPVFLDYAGRNFRLQSNSPCINSGRNGLVVGDTDFDGLPRIAGGTVDIGAYEFQNPATLLSMAWLQQYGLPTDGSVDFADADGDRASNWHEWQAGTDPTNFASLFRMFDPVRSGANLLVTWIGATNRSYALETSTNLSSPYFDLVATNLFSDSVTNTFTHTNAAGARPKLYRVRIE